jgi:RNA 3'-terminal phosphate cyclase (ATP)
LEFHPQSKPVAGSYYFDVAQAADGGSAGSVTLIFQALLWPLLFAPEPSQLTLAGGTHVPYSPPYHYLAEVALPVFARLGVQVTPELKAWGWYPAGGGVIRAEINPVTRLRAVSFAEPIVAQVQGVAAVTNLPAHIPHRMARRAHNLLAEAGLKDVVQALRERGRAPGAGLFLWLPQAGFSSLGRKGLPADKVAETAVSQLLAFLEKGVMFDKHLADQLLLPLALGDGRTTFTTEQLTQHTLTNARLIRQWLEASIDIQGALDSPASITITGIDFGGD